jgi:hypothetical protein
MLLSENHRLEMRISFSVLVVVLTGLVQSHSAWLNPKYQPHSISGLVASVPIDLKPLYNNRAFGHKVDDSNYDGFGSK